MKKLLLVITLLAATVAHADYYDWRHHHPTREVIRVERNGGDMLVPLIIGGLAGAAIANANQQPVVVQQQPVVVQIGKRYRPLKVRFTVSVIAINDK